ncbi:MAG: hypothetical protein JSS49_03350 [Planctomycetes bacterium]|nr:hypothetical protein [Planctomycetota bacterium]
MNSDEPLDPLAELLRDMELPPIDLSQRNAIFARTRSVLWRRRWGRRGAWGMAFVACYSVGVLTGRAWPVPANDSLSLQGLPPVHVPSPAMPVPALAVPLPTHPTQETIPQTHPVESTEEPQAPIVAVPSLDVKVSSFEKLRQAGDRQLNQLGNLQAAIGCYRRALDCATENELKVVPERDSWLLIPLKEARLEARKHVSKKS